MFLKKKINKIRTILSHASSSKREAFRLGCVEVEAGSFDFLGKQVKMINLSAGGLSFLSDEFKPGDKGAVTITIPSPPTLVIEAELEVLAVSNSNRCHCRFTEITEETTESIHQFILNCQIKRLRIQKREATSHEC